MPTLEWIGKDKVINHHLAVPYRVLERRYSYDERGQHAEDNGSENMVIHGDNLEALKALLPKYEGRVKCIYIDPPYNTANSTTANQKWVYTDIKARFDITAILLSAFRIRENDFIIFANSIGNNSTRIWDKRLNILYTSMRNDHINFFKSPQIIPHLSF